MDWYSFLLGMAAMGVIIWAVRSLGWRVIYWLFRSYLIDYKSPDKLS